MTSTFNDDSGGASVQNFHEETCGGEFERTFFLRDSIGQAAVAYSSINKHLARSKAETVSYTV